uniref:Transporter n=1 Tax=Syphacia muris TaxID=451379 RepID=A0A0N5AFS5_9BILA
MCFAVEQGWQVSLRQQIEQLAKRNAEQKKCTQVLDRTQEMDDLIIRLRQLLDSNPAEAACIYVQAISILDETDRLIKGKLPNNTSFTKSSSIRLSEDKTSSWRQSRLSTLRETQTPNQVISEKTLTTMRFTTFADREDVCHSNSEESVEEKKSGFIRIWEYMHKRLRKLSYSNKSDSRSYTDNANDSNTTSNSDDVRDLWKTQFEFFCSVLGFMVGVGNFIKFPSLLYQHGGGVFLIPYFVCVTLFGLPFVFLHLCIGQYSGQSASGAFKQLMPIASGIGWALVILALPVSIYYNIIVAWSIYYFWFSLRGFFTGGLPWGHCNPTNLSLYLDWPLNTPCCVLQASTECFAQPHAISSPEAYFHYEVLNRTPKIYDEQQLVFDGINGTISAFNGTLQISESYDLDPTLGPIQGHLVLALAFAWIFVFFGVFKGVGSIGWAVTITSTLPYFLMIILLIRGMSLPGAEEGLAFLFKPNVEKIWSIPMWKAAAEQVFYSLGIDAGPLISMAAFSRYRNNIYRDAVAFVLGNTPVVITVSFRNTFTSILAAMVIFSFIGFLAQNQNQAVDAILRHDSLYIAFTVYPGVTSFMNTIGPLWAASFFGMLTISAVDAEFAWLEMIISSVMKQFNVTSRRWETGIVAGLCLFCLLCGLPLTARGGIFVFHSVENLNANWNSFTLSLLQTIVVCYIYGIDNFVEDVGEMLRTPTSLRDELQSNNLSIKQVGLYEKAKFFFGPTGGYIKWTWSLCSPLFLAFLLVASFASYERVTLEGYPLSFYYELVAWIVMAGPLCAVPIIAIKSIITAQRNNRSLITVFDTSKWRHKRDSRNEAEPKHRKSSVHDYMYIDPLCRVASKHLPNAVRVESSYGITGQIHDDGNDYRAKVEVLEMVGEWHKESAEINGFDSTETLNDCVARASSEFGQNRSLTTEEFSLFGPPPPNPFTEKKSSTVIHRSHNSNTRSNSIAQFNISQEGRLEQERRSKDDISVLRKLSAFESYELENQPSVDSISITPIGMSGNCHENIKSASNSPNASSASMVLKRPKPIVLPNS